MQTRTSPRTKSGAAKTPSTALLHRHPDTGAMHALSTTDCATVYVIKNTVDRAWTCSCPAGSTGRACYHATAAQLRFSGFFTRPTAVIVPGTDPDPERPTPAAPAVRCFSCGDVLDAATAQRRPDGFVNHRAADWDACRLHVLTVRRQYGIAA